MRSVTFTVDELDAIAHERYFHPDPHVQRKMEVLWLYAPIVGSRRGTESA